jgi:hypothetical protein
VANVRNSYELPKGVSGRKPNFLTKGVGSTRQQKHLQQPLQQQQQQQQEQEQERLPANA